MEQFAMNKNHPFEGGGAASSPVASELDKPIPSNQRGVIF